MALKVVIFLFLSSYLGSIVVSKELISFQLLGKVYHPEVLPYVLLVFFLFPINWALETFKWKMLVSRIEKVNFWKAYRGVLTGVSFGFATPHGLGDYAGRILQLSSPSRVRLIGAVFLSRIAQFYITFLFGSFSLWYFIFHVYVTDAFITNVLAYILALANLFFVFLFIFHKGILRIFKKIKFLNFAYKYFEIIKAYGRREMIIILLLSLIRYLVFTGQFMLLLYAFKVSVNAEVLFFGVNFIFLVKSIVPTLFDLGVRESSALYFFGFFHTNEENILLSSIVLWMINILLPAFIGLFMIFKLKLLNKE